MIPVLGFYQFDRPTNYRPRTTELYSCTAAKALCNWLSAPLYWVDLATPGIVPRTFHCFVGLRRATCDLPSPRTLVSLKCMLPVADGWNIMDQLERSVCIAKYSTRRFLYYSNCLYIQFTVLFITATSFTALLISRSYIIISNNRWSLSYYNFLFCFPYFCLFSPEVLPFSVRFFLMRFSGAHVFTAKCPVDVFPEKRWSYGVAQFDEKPSIALSCCFFGLPLGTRWWRTPGMR